MYYAGEEVSHAIAYQPEASARDITPAAKKVIYQPEARARDPVRFPRWRVGLICSSMRNFLAWVIKDETAGRIPPFDRMIDHAFAISGYGSLSGRARALA
jgi:hypothetical protein